jgi:hypothetical protein
VRGRWRWREKLTHSRPQTLDSLGIEEGMKEPHCSPTVWPEVMLPLLVPARAISEPRRRATPDAPSIRHSKSG